MVDRQRRCDDHGRAAEDQTVQGKDVQSIAGRDGLPRQPQGRDKRILRRRRPGRGCRGSCCCIAHQGQVSRMPAGTSGKRHRMSLRVYNTLTRKKELFEPVRPGKVGIYLCGPTVYKSPHIGHMVGPVIFDAVKRYLTFKGYEVTWVVNITDVEDKLIVEAARTGTTVEALAEQHTRE